MNICEYGCGRKAIHQFKNGKWCCSTNIAKCPKNRKINSEKKPWNKGKTLSEKTKQKMSESKKGDKAWQYGKTGIFSNEVLNRMSEAKKGKEPWNKGKVMTKEFCENVSKGRTGITPEREYRKGISHYIKTYPTFSKIEEMRYNPKNHKFREIQVHCKNHNCPNSKEHGGWFSPNYQTIYERIRQLEHPEGNDGNYFYCSDECKNKCPLFNMRPSSIINKNNLPYEVYYTSEEYQIFRNEVLKREEHNCEYCGEKATYVHHSRPQKLEPFYSLDPDFGIACCKKCHYEYGHKDECSTGKLANTICI